MSVNDVVERVRARIAQADPNNRKVVGIFQWKTSTSNWGENRIDLVTKSCGFLLLCEFISVFDLKDLKVYEGVVENPDTTLIVEADVLMGIMKKEIVFEDAKAQVS